MILLPPCFAVGVEVFVTREWFLLWNLLVSSDQNTFSFMFFADCSRDVVLGKERLPSSTLHPQSRQRIQQLVVTCRTQPELLKLPAALSGAAAGLVAASMAFPFPQFWGGRPIFSPLSEDSLHWVPCWIWCCGNVFGHFSWLILMKTWKLSVNQEFCCSRKPRKYLEDSTRISELYLEWIRL